MKREDLGKETCKTIINSNQIVYQDYFGGIQRKGKLFLVHFLFANIFAIPAAIPNFKDIIYANNLSMVNIVSTAIFIIFWLVYSILMGSRKRNDFIYFSIIFWVINLLIYTIAYHLTNLAIGLIPLIYIICPMYAISFIFKHHFSINLPYSVIMSTLSVFTVNILGYAVGRSFKIN